VLAEKETELVDAEVRARALRVAAIVARKAGIPRTEPVVLSCSRHVCVLLPELSTVARIGPATAADAASAIRELAVTRHLFQAGAPVVPPHEDMPSEPWVEEGMMVTLWPYVAHESAGYDDQNKVARAAHALRRVHHALADYRGELPSYREKIDGCVALLRGQDAPPTLAADDRRFLLSTYELLADSLMTLSVGMSPIHGDAHMGNVFFAAGGPLWTDFEAACLGPREWDAAGVLHPTAFQPLDPQVYRVMLGLRSLCVTVWCSALAADPDKRAAAQYHLAYLKEHYAMGATATHSGTRSHSH
jgi:hypothetical protein